MNQYRKYSKVPTLEGQKRINLKSSICKRCLRNLSNGKPKYPYGPFSLCHDCFFRQKAEELQKFKQMEKKMEMMETTKEETTKEETTTSDQEGKKKKKNK
jgi:hypothetical protein